MIPILINRVRQKNVRDNTLYMWYMTSSAILPRRSAPLGPKSEGPSKNLLSKSPVYNRPYRLTFMMREFAAHIPLVECWSHHPLPIHSFNEYEKRGFNGQAFEQGSGQFHVSKCALVCWRCLSGSGSGSGLVLHTTPWWAITVQWSRTFVAATIKFWSELFGLNCIRPCWIGLL